MILSPKEQIQEYTARGWWGEKTLIDLFLDNVERSPDAMAVVDPPNRAGLTPGEPLRLSYAAAKTATDRLAQALLEAGVGNDDVVMVQLPNIVELVVTYLACARLGAILSPLPVQFRTHELRHVLGLTEPKVFITTRSFGDHDYVEMVRGLQPEFPSVNLIIALGDDLPDGVRSLAAILDTDADTRRVDAHAAEHPCSADDVFTICWTSGTVAEPKGVPRSHNLWIAIAYATVDAAGLEDGDALLNPFPLVNMSGIGGMLVPWLLTRGKLAMHHPLDLPVFLAQMGGEQIAYTVAPPVLLNLLLLRPGLLENADLSHIRNIGSGSSPLSPWMVTRWQEEHDIPILNFFGANEGTALVSDAVDIPDPAERALYFPRLGVPGFTWSNRVADMIETRLIDPETRTVITEPEVAGGARHPRRDGLLRLLEAAQPDRGVVRRRRLLPDRRPVRHRRRGRGPLSFRGPLEGPHHPRRDEHRAGGDRIPAGRSSADRRRGDRRRSRWPQARRRGRHGRRGAQGGRGGHARRSGGLPEREGHRGLQAAKKLVTFGSLPRNAVGKVLKREIRQQLAADRAAAGRGRLAVRLRPAAASSRGCGSRRPRRRSRRSRPAPNLSTARARRGPRRPA